MIRRKASVLQKTRLSGLLLRGVGLRQTELADAHFPGQCWPIWAGREGGLNNLVGQAEVAEILSNAGAALASICVIGHEVRGIAPIVDDPAVH